MSTSTIDEKWRLVVPKEIRKAIRISPRTPVNIKLSKDSFIVRPLHRRIGTRKGDSLTWLLQHPAHIRLKKLKKIDLEKIEEKMWLP